MNELFASLIESFRASSLASKLTAGLVALGVVLAVGVSAVVSNRPHYSMLLSGLSDNESAAAMKALAEASIPFEVSQPPGPFVVYVDESDRATALAAIYQSSAMVPLEKGIPSDRGGMSSVFMSSGERSQISQKRLWGEMEGILEALDFVTKARVQTSTAEASPFSGSADVRRTCATQLQVAGGLPITADQAQTVVLLISRGLEIEPDNIVLSDQSGRLLHGAGEEQSEDDLAGDWLEYKQRYDAALAGKANAVLNEILGPHKARVEVDSLWNFEQSTTSSETVSKGTVVSETKNATATPISNGSNSASGTTANVDFGVGNAAVPDQTGGDSGGGEAPLLSTSDEEKREYDPSRVRTETVRVAPTLQRLSIALFLDDSIGAEQVAALESAVQAAVGYDQAKRSDVFQTVTLPFALSVDAQPAEGDDPESGGSESSGPETAQEGAPGEAQESAEPSAMTELLLRRGVEIAVALAFIGLLLSSLRSPKKAAGEQAEAAEAEKAEEQLDPELLAQAQVQELLTGNPEKVGEILSQWARDETKVGGGA